MAGNIKSLAALLFLAGSLILLWFVILSGITRTSPLRQTFFLSADTSGITGARSVSQWTYFKVCGLDNLDCGPARPGLPLGDAWDTDASNVPAELIGSYGGGTTSYTYWYMWRFGWVFYLIALFFETATFFVGFLACCGRLGAAISGIMGIVSLLFLSVAVSLMTATFVKMRNAFVADNRSAEFGSYAFGFSWGAWGALLISTILFCMARKRHTDRYAEPRSPRGFGGFGLRRKSTAPSRRSYDGRRVKEEYA
ncbi:SUR7/PalI family-domain-containing protein [Podospora fimiseda]|uniref:SUR7/PalI family-domain-containing protein n=1 Tax=Podospora fimiseda TaxID=252190 RepID=A0AAN7H5U2_9PEZI|nr:SUR7/PalI family-domain-containing protein [Podospora fimiseda]